MPAAWPPSKPPPGHRPRLSLLNLNPAHTSMLRISSAFAFFALIIPLLPAADPPPTGDELLRLVRLSYSGQNYKLTGQLRDDATGRSEAMALNIEQDIIRFRFSNPNLIVHLNLATAPASLRVVQAGGMTPVPLSQYGEKIRGFAMSYEDLSMRFLYWPNAQYTGEEALRAGVKCWKARVTSPDGATPYGTVDLWIHQGSGGLAKMEAYDRKGKLVKKFEVRKIQEHEGKKVLKEMRVESIVPGTGKTDGRTYMTLDKPEKD